MNLHIDKESELTAYEQLREQIIFLISTGEIAIGDEMPSVRGLARQLGVSLNTVSKVYTGLVRGGWLVERPGAHHMVVERKRRGEPSFSGASLDELIDHMIELAVGNGFTLQQLAHRLRGRLLRQAPDHLLIVEPDPGMGEIMQEEIGRETGYRLPKCSLKMLQQTPAIGIGALLIAPVYMVERLGQMAVDRTRIIGVSYTSMDGLIGAITRLRQPSMIGWVSVSEAGLKTISGMAAPAISNRHTSHLFLLERGEGEEGDGFRLRRFKVGDYRPSDFLSAEERSVAPAVMKPRGADGDKEVASSDLRCMDLLFLDSVAARFIQHPKAVAYRLLSKGSLEAIGVAARGLG